MIKTRCLPESNYKAIFLNNITTRFAIDPNKPITDLKYPEFMDIKITNKCRANCSYCYQNSKNENNYNNIVDKLFNYFSSMTKNERPFQVALGGGEPTEHPDFIEALKILYQLKIIPNYTTNGMNINENIIEATKKYCGGVAVSTHEHLEKYWKKAVAIFISNKINTNLHCIISDKKSVDNFVEIFNTYKKDIYYFVVLPYMVQGRAKNKQLDFDYFFNEIKKLDSKYYNKIAYGAKFYNEIRSRNLDISIYEPEIMSKFLDLKNMKIYNSSFSNIN